MPMNKMTLLILSCELFSDLWDAHVYQLEKYWSDRGMDTYIVTDKKHETSYEGVKVIAAGEGVEFTDRLKYALEQIDSEYIFITLDDYFLIKNVSNESIEHLVGLMDEQNYDYIRLFKRPTKSKGKRIKGYKRVNDINVNNRYSVNLYSGIWRKEFLKNTLREPLNPWVYEVRLWKVAMELGARCAVSNNHEFVILDVVRKGKILNKANNYFKKHDIYHGSRPVHTHWYEFKLGVRTWGARLMPKFIVNAARKFMIKQGHHYFSQDD